MKEATQKEDFLGLDKARYLELASVVHERDYTSLALSFIDNHARILHYLSQGDYDLLPKNSSEGRRKYSLIDLLLMHVIIDCRQFGMEKAALFELKQYLLGSDAHVMVEKFTKNKKEMEKLLQDQGLNALQAKKMADEVMNNRDKILEQSTTRLLQFTLSAIITREPHYLLINKDGGCITYTESNFPNLLLNDDPFFKEFYRAPHLSICLNEIISFFLSKDYIEDKLKRAIFSDEEWKVINMIRYEKPKTLNIYFSEDSKPESFTLTKKKHIEAEARLTEVLTKNPYQKN